MEAEQESNSITSPNTIDQAQEMSNIPQAHDNLSTSSSSFASEQEATIPDIISPN
jgi:hypothetical protein